MNVGVRIILILKKAGVQVFNMPVSTAESLKPVATYLQFGIITLLQQQVLSWIKIRVLQAPPPILLKLQKVFAPKAGHYRIKAR